MDYNDLRWEHLDKQRLLVGISCFTMWLRAVVYPFGLVKTRMQAVAKSSQMVYTNTYHAFSSIIRHEGVRALYQGFWVNSVSIINSPIYLFTLEGTRTLLIHANAQRQWVSEELMDQRISGFVGGAMASLATQTLTVPLDNVTQRLMIHQHQGERCRVPSAASVVRDVLQQSGLRGFYRGYVASLMTHAPAAALFWSVYYPTKAQLRDVAGLPKRSANCWDPKELIISVATGAISAAVTTLLTNPIDVVRTRMQLTDGKQSPTIWGTLRSILQAEGLRGFRRGMAPRMLSMTITISLASGGYEAIKRLAASPREAKDLMLKVRV